MRKALLVTLPALLSLGLATPALAAPVKDQKPLPVASCNGKTPAKDVHGADRPCTAPPVATPTVTVAAPVQALAVVSITSSGSGFDVRATDDTHVTYVTVTWRNAAGRAASCLVQTPSSGTRTDGVYNCSPVGELRQPVLAGTYKVHAVYVGDRDGNRRSYFAADAAAFNAGFTR